MMRIESGPTGERVIRTLLMFLMIGGFSVWFAYDGWVGYPKKNIQEHLQQLSAEERAKVKSLKIYKAVTRETLRQAQAALQEPDVKRLRASLEALYGGPPSWENEDGWFYFGPAYMIKVPLKDGRPRPTVIAHITDKTATSILWQKIFAGFLGVIAVFLLWKLIRVRRTRLVLEDRGLTYQGKGPIGWDEIKALDTRQFQEKGWVDLVYDDHGSERKLRLDEYHLAAFDDVIDALCARKGFENPLPVETGDSHVSA